MIKIITNCHYSEEIKLVGACTAAAALYFGVAILVMHCWTSGKCKDEEVRKSGLAFGARTQGALDGRHRGWWFVPVLSVPLFNSWQHCFLASHWQNCLYSSISFRFVSGR